MTLDPAHVVAIAVSSLALLGTLAGVVMHRLSTLERRVAKAANSFETHALAKLRPAYPPDISRPGSPKSTGIRTVQPSSRTRRARPATSGVMPGISAMTITAGPSPLRYTSWLTPL